MTTKTYFDRQQPARGLDDGIHRHAIHRAPIRKVGGRQPRVPPKQEIVQHDVLQVGATGLPLLSEMQRQARIAPVELRQLADPLVPIGRVRGRRTSRYDVSSRLRHAQGCLGHQFLRLMLAILGTRQIITGRLIQMSQSSGARRKLCYLEEEYNLWGAIVVV